MAFGEFRLGQAEALEVLDLVAHARGLPRFGKPRGHGRKNIPPVERPAERLKKVMLRVDVPHRQILLLLEDHGEDAVVRGHEKLGFTAHEQRSPLGSHAGVHDHDVDGLRREITVGRGDRQRAIENIIRRDAVRDVHNGRVRIDRQNDALKRPDQVVGQAVVGREGNDRVRQGGLPSISVEPSSGSAVHGTRRRLGSEQR